MQHLYVFFAYIFWPMWIPFYLLIAEKQPLRKNIIGLPLVIGIGVAIKDATAILSHGVTASIRKSSIQYLDVNLFYDPIFYYYLTAVLLPTFISSLRLMWLYGFLVLIFSF